MTKVTTETPLPAFKLERFFAKYEFAAPYLLCCSDCEPLSMKELLDVADEECKQLWNGLTLGYTETAGLPLLREEICKQYTTIAPADVTVMAPEEGVYLAMRALLSPGNHVVCTFPGYQSLYSIAQAMGCRVTLWEPEPSFPAQVSASAAELPAGQEQPSAGMGFSVPTLVKTLEDAAADGCRVHLVVVNFPHNPTGFLPTHQDWLQLIQACQAHGCYLFSDEMYRGLELDSARKLPSACDLYTKAITLSGVSKTLGLPGLRIGWLATRADLGSNQQTGTQQPGRQAAICQADRPPASQPLQARIRELKDYTSICCSAPSEVLALAALRAGPQIISRHMDTICNNIGLIETFFSNFPQLFEWHRPVAGSVAFPRLITDESIEQFCERVVQGCGVLLLPATMYDHETSIKRGHFRIGLGRRNLPVCLEKLREYLEGVQ